MTMMDRRRMLRTVASCLVVASVGMASVSTTAEAVPVSMGTASTVDRAISSELPIVAVGRCRVRAQREVCHAGRCTYTWRWIWVPC
jgi:hypothetical protein